MLVLTRKTGESIVIMDVIQVTVQRLSKGRVRLLIDAPKDVVVLRGELVTEEPKPTTGGGK